MRIYVELKLTEPLKQAVREVGNRYTCVFEDELRDDEEKRSAIRKSDFIFGNVKPAEWLEEAENLKWIHFASAGFDAYRGLRKDVIATNMRDYFSGPCAETIVAGIMALYRGIAEFALLKQSKKWVGHSIRKDLYVLSKRHVIILGAGGIGQRIGKMLSGFECQVSYYARNPNTAIINTPDELLQALPSTDIVIGALPGTKETAGLFTNEMIDALPANAIFCNVGRGNLLADETYLVQALSEQRIAGAVLDVTAQEPLPADHALWSCPNTILTQHSGGGNLTELEGIVALFLTNLKNYEDERPLMNRVELNRGY